MATTGKREQEQEVSVSIHATPVRTVWCAVLTGLLVACSTAGPGASGRSWVKQQTNMSQPQQVMADQTDEAEAEAEPVGNRFQQIIDQLKLTKDQVAKIQDLIQQRPKMDEDAIKARVETLKGILSAPVVDVNALTAHIEQDRQHIHKRLANLIGVITGIQAILTPEQRDILAKMPPPPPVQQPDLAADIGLTDQQKAALEAMRPTAADQSLRQAIHNFMVSGDRNALQAAVDASIDRLPSATTIANALASLTQQQRQKLIDAVAERIGTRKEAAAANLNQ
jgi:Spy/CpxP family protein refolding chaperone